MKAYVVDDAEGFDLIGARGQAGDLIADKCRPGNLVGDLGRKDPRLVGARRERPAVGAGGLLVLDVQQAGAGTGLTGDAETSTELGERRTSGSAACSRPSSMLAD